MEQEKRYEELDIEVIVNWDGPGWYAGKSHYSDGEWWVAEYEVGDDPDDEPDTYTLGLGTPVWYDEEPK